MAGAVRLPVPFRRYVSGGGKPPRDCGPSDAGKSIQAASRLNEAARLMKSHRAAPFGHYALRADITRVPFSHVSPQSRIAARIGMSAWPFLVSR